MATSFTSTSSAATTTTTTIPTAPTIETTTITPTAATAPYPTAATIPTPTAATNPNPTAANTPNPTAATTPTPTAATTPTTPIHTAAEAATAIPATTNVTSGQGAGRKFTTGAAIKKRSRFDVRMYTSIQVAAGQTRRLDGYNKVWTPCQFMDHKAGVYTTPRTDRYLFGVSSNVFGNGCVDRYIRTSGGTRQLLTGLRNDGQETIELECEEGVAVWVEAVGVDGTVNMECSFNGGIV